MPDISFYYNNFYKRINYWVYMGKLTRMVSGGIEDLPVEKDKLKEVGSAEFEYSKGNSIVYTELFGFTKTDGRLEIEKEIHNKETFLDELERFFSSEKLFLVNLDYSSRTNPSSPDIHTLKGRLYKEKFNSASSQ
jgi:hypothetical protein